jgi:hypothetical protein
MKFTGLLGVLVFTMLAYSQEPILKPTASLQMQMQKGLWQEASDHNLEQLYLRANLGLDYKEPGFDAKVNVRAFFGTFGKTYVSEIDTTGKVKSSSMDDIYMEQGWVRWTWGNTALRVGRWVYVYENSLHLGGYLDLEPGYNFWTKIYYPDGAELTAKYGLLDVNLSFEAQDKNLNTALIRIEDVLTIDKLRLAAGYKSNAWDRLANSEAVLTSRSYFSASMEVFKDLKPWVEVGYLDQSEKIVPVFAGFTIPTGGAIDLLSLETEFVQDRSETLAGQNNEDLLFALTMAKSLGKRAKVFLALANDPAGLGYDHTKLGLRLHSGF